MHGQQILDTLCINGGSTHLAVPYQAGLSYQWSVNGGQIVGRSDTNDVLIQWGGTPGLFSSMVTTTDERGCISDTATAWMYLRGPVQANAKGPNIVCKGEMVTVESGLPTDFVWGGGKRQSSISFVANQDTTLMLVALNGNCGNDTLYHQITTIDPPIASLSFIEDSLMVGDSRMLYYTGDPTSSISWYLNGVLVSQTNSMLIDFDGKGEYEIMQVLQNGGCTDTIKKTVYVDALFKVFIPNTFTPNGDGTNELWTFKGIGISSFEAKIFNRWGEQIYHWNENSPIQGWDGTNSGKRSNMDAYIYKITVRDMVGREYYYHGKLHLVR